MNEPKCAIDGLLYVGEYKFDQPGNPLKDVYVWVNHTEKVRYYSTSAYTVVPLNPGEWYVQNKATGNPIGFFPAFWESRFTPVDVFGKGYAKPIEIDPLEKTSLMYLGKFLMFGTQVEGFHNTGSEPVEYAHMFGTEKVLPGYAMFILDVEGTEPFPAFQFPKVIFDEMIKDAVAVKITT